MKRLTIALLVLVTLFTFVACKDEPEPPKQYTVTFDVQGHGTAPDVQKILEGQKAIRPEDPNETGFTFGGWYKEDSCTNAWNFENNTITADITFYAKWTVSVYSVSFDMKGHGSAVESQTVTHGSKATKPADPVDENYAFWAWFCDEACTIKFDFNSDITADTTVYAKWTEKKTITYHTKYGTLAVESDRVGLGLLITEPAKPTYLTNYAFNGWYSAEEGGKLWNFTEDVVEADMHLYARWTQYCDVVFNMNGHGGDNVTQSNKVAGNPVGIIANPSETGYEFGGWYKNPECTIPWVFAEDTISENPTNLYAKWTANTVFVSLVSSGNTQGTAKATFGETSLDVTTSPVKTGCTIEGYYTSSNFSKKVANGDKTLIPNVSGYTDASGKWTRLDPATLYVRWNYTVTFVDPDNLLQSVPSAYTLKEGELISVPSATPKAPAEENYEYRWSSVSPTSGKQQTTYVFTDAPSNNTTLYYLKTYVGTDFTVELYSGKFKIQKYTGSGTNVTVPSNIDGKKIDYIEYQAFRNNTAVTSITISEGISRIRQNAFQSCENLTSISIPASVTNLEGGFSRYSNNITTLTVSPENTHYRSIDNVIYDYDLTKLILANPQVSSISIPSTVTEIGDCGFAENQNLRDIVIPNHITTIGSGAFDGSKITSVVIPEGVTAIGGAAFHYCFSLASVTIPSTVTSIGVNAFCYANITSISLPSGLKTIGKMAFYGSSLTSITIPESVEVLGNAVFSMCSKLETLTLERNEVYPFTDYLLNINTSLTQIRVPEALVDDYKAAEGWSDYASIIVGISL